jgi:glycosyltransferase involved in cell wall biosynthesis
MPREQRHIVNWVQSSRGFNSLYLQAEALAGILKEALGVETHVWAADRRETRKLLNALVSGVPVIWHYGGFDPLLLLTGWLYDPILVYHNITPARFFWHSDPLVGLRAVAGRIQVRMLRRKRWVAMGRYNEDELVRLGCTKVKPWTNALATNYRSSRAKAPGPQIVYAGRIVENKNCLELVESVDHAAKVLRVPIRLVLVGSGKKGSRYCRALALRLQEVRERGRIECIWYESNLSRRELSDIYAESWLFASASLHEGFGLPHCEAILQGTAATYLQCGATEEVLEGYGMVPLSGRSGFGEAIARLLDSVVEREALLRRQAEVVERYTDVALAKLVGGVFMPWLGVEGAPSPLG